MKDYRLEVCLLINNNSIRCSLRETLCHIELNLSILCMKNIEIKAYCSHPDRAMQILLDEGADFMGEDHQVDTYFKVNHGRLKLREGNIENALIAYKRENTSSTKQSDFMLYHSVEPAKLKEMLSKTLGINVIVDKSRKIFFIDHVKFHIDHLDGLGNFIEIEVTDPKDIRSVETMHTTCRHFMKLLEISDKDLISHSYSDMISGQF